MFWGFGFLLIWPITELIDKPLFDAEDIGPILTVSAAFSLLAGWLERLQRAIDKAEPSVPTVYEVVVSGFGGLWVIAAVGLSVFGAAQG